MNIYFFRPYDNYGFLSNWWNCSFKGTIGDTEYSFNSTEQYFMAYKAYYFSDTESFNRILQTRSPLDAKTIGRAVKNFNVERWNLERDTVMYRALQYKFKGELADKLLSTGNAKLYEASPYDRIWGIGLSVHVARQLSPDEYPGENRLGKLLERLREELQKSR